MTERYGAEANGHVLVAGRAGRRRHIAHLAREPRFDLIEADVIGLPPLLPRVGQVSNRACAASPPHDQADPLHTMMTSVLGTIAWFSREVAPRERARPEPLAAAAV